jgi:LemA protein
MILLYIIGPLALVLIVILWILYNGLVRARNIVIEAFSGIDVQLKKRYELIPNLIEAVKGYNAYEAEILEKLVEKRNEAMSSKISDTASNDRSITGALKSFRINVEAYPDLRSNTQFLKLMDNLTTVEDELSMARRYYNGATRDFNTKIEVFPTVVVAKMMGFMPREFYKIEQDAERNAPELNLND